MTTPIAVIGCGYWGAKHVRVFNELPGVRLTMVADPSAIRRAHVEETYPNIPTTGDYRDVLSGDAGGVVIATPVSTHFRLAREALLAGKDVLVEKPLTNNASEARELCLLAERLGRVLMVGHTFLYHPAVEYLRQLVDSGTLGTIYYADTARLNLGLFQRDTNVIWDLAPHDLSILLWVLGVEPHSIRARGISHVGTGQLDVAFLDLLFPNKMTGNIRVSWLDPCKVRRITLVGSKKMVVFNDAAGPTTLRLYDRGVNIPHETDEFGDFHLAYRYGEVAELDVPQTEPLLNECQHFVDRIHDRDRPRSDGWNGHRIVQLLETAHESLSWDGINMACDPAQESPYQVPRVIEFPSSMPLEATME